MPRTKQQLAVINSLGKDLLVSAGAGSGKTSVMIERAVNYLTSDCGNVEKLLMITFTKAAASEMRVKMEKELQGVLQNTTDEKKINQIKKQINLLGQADICTVDKFCEKIISRYFYVLGIDPSFSIIDEPQAAVYQNRAITVVFDKLLKQDDEDFLGLVECYAEKRNFAKLFTLVIGVNEFLKQNPNLDEFEKKILAVYDADLKDGDIANVINNYVCERIGFYVPIFTNLRQQAQAVDNEKVVKVCDKILASLCVVKKENGYEKNKTFVCGISFPDKPRETKNDEPIFVEQYDVYGSIKSECSKVVNSIKEKCFYDEDINEIKKDILLAKQNVKALLKVERLFMQEYAKIKSENNQVDFTDLEFFALKILENEDVKNQIRNSYDQVYVDEYQDINDVQDNLITSVSNEGNLFMVGDVKQSIYGFRYTNPQIFVDKFNLFSKKCDKKEAMQLNDNFRTDNAVLQFINYIFARVMTEEVAAINYEKTGMLNGGLKFETPENAVQKSCICVVKQQKKEKEEKQVATGVYSVLDAETQAAEEENEYTKAEGYIVAQKIKDIMQNQKVLFDPKKNTMRPIKYSDITLLVRSRGHISEIVDTLRSLNIPVNSISGESIFEEYEVQVLHNALKLLYNSQDDFAFVSFLMGPCVGISMQELSDLRILNKKEKFYQIIKENQSNPKIIFAKSVLENVQKVLQTGTIFDALNSLIDQTNLLYKISQMEGGKQRVLNVKTFVEHFLSQKYNNDLVSYFNFVSKSEKIKIPIANSYTENAVSVCTMHESKGLEYPIVFVVATGNEFSDKSFKGTDVLSSSYGIGLEAIDKERRTKRTSIIRQAIIVEEKQKQIAEELRLLYVALTRAKNNLYIVGKADFEKVSHFRGKYDIFDKNTFMDIILLALDDETLDSLRNGTSKVVVNKGKIDEFAVETYLPFEEENNSDEGLPFDEKKIDIFKLKQNLEDCLNFEYPYQKSTDIMAKSSVTKLMKENAENLSNIEAPVLFKNTEVDIETNVDVGIAFHKAMELMDYNLKTETEIKNHLEKVLSADEFSLVNCGTITKCVKHFAPLMDGAKVYREQKFFLNVPYNQIVVDSDILDDIIIEGVIDLLIVKNNEAILVDFKTTNIKDANTLRQKYKIQLDCYQKAVESALNCRVSKKIIYSFLNEMEIIV